MIVLVSDTSVLIDLERGRFLDSCFQLPYEFAVPDLLYRRELADFGGQALIARGLRIEELSGDELAFAQKARTDDGRLSVPDAYAYALAVKREWTLLTGDGALRQRANAEAIAFHGVLWVLDELFDRAIVAGPTLVEGLNAIADHPRCRLPRDHVQARLRRYRAAGAP